MKVVPKTVGGLAGGTVYPRSPIRTVPAPVLVYVLARRAKLLTPVRSKEGLAAVLILMVKNPAEIRAITMGSTRKIFFISYHPYPRY